MTMYVFTSPLNKAVYLRPFRFNASYKQLYNVYLRHQQRQQIKQLSDSALNDIGITRAQAMIESQRWFWQ